MLKKSIKNAAKKILPPIILETFRRLHRTDFEYSGNYSSFEEARRNSTGYDKNEVFERIKTARMKVQRGEKAYERDSAVFDKVEYFWPLLSSILFAEAADGYLKLLDFGGSLGTTYFQNLAFIGKMKNVRWVVVEQPTLSDFGKKNLKDGVLDFSEDFQKTLNELRPNVFLSSSSIHYLEEPYKILEAVKKAGTPYLVFDRTVFSDESGDRIVVQKATAKSYKETTFPVWLLNYPEFKNFFTDRYEIMAEWYSIGDPIPLKDGLARNRGILFMKKKN